MRITCLIILFAGGAAVAKGQSFTRMPIEDLYSTEEKIVFREIVVTSKGDMLITASMGFASIVGQELEYALPTGRIEDQKGTPMIVKDVYNFLGFKSAGVGSNDIVYLISDNNNFGLVDFDYTRSIIIPPFNFANTRDLGNVFLDNEGDLYFASSDSFFIVKEALRIWDEDRRRLLYGNGFDRDSNVVVTGGIKHVQSFSLGKNVRPTCFADDNESGIYIGTNQGIYFFDKRTGRSFDVFKNKDKNVTVTSISPSRASFDLWFSTAEYGLGRYDLFSKGVRYYPYNKSGPSPVSTLTRISSHEFLVAATDSLPAIFSTEFGRYDFISDTAFGKGKNSTADIKVGSGKMVALILNGDLYISPEFLKSRNVDDIYSPGPYIKEILVNGKSVREIIHNSDRADSVKSVRLKYYQNNIEIIYAGRGISRSDTVSFEWKLEGKWEDWKEVPFSMLEERMNMMAADDLTPGTYLFRARMKKAGGDWLKNEAVLEIIIDPPFWQTLTFWIFGILSIGVFIILIVQWKVRSVRRQERAKLKHERELFELEAKALRAQMNPHFIFNCLNSIKSLIQHSENKKAVAYLTTFSKLIRTLFNNSDKRQVTLYDELETCKLYVALEAMRLEGRLKYSFEIAEHLDLKSVMVPALIVQPFIENAIWHGIVPNKNGTLKVTVSSNAMNIICEIEDDGIGRELSNAVKSTSAGVFPSKGINLSRERLHLENRLNEGNASVRIFDKYDNGVATGTRVIIQFNLC